ncbi:MAG: DsbA family protein [Caulobacteraceae bacterium]|nr:DsbA family protein [Caulobacter sp.]
MILAPHRRAAALAIAAAALLPAAGWSAPVAKPAPYTPLPGDMALGSRRAPVTVVEYASVGCPVCGRWHKEVWPEFRAKYVNTGKVRFVFREMLVGGDGEVAVAAAGFLLARAAGPGNYFPVVDAVFDSQPALFDDPQAQLSGVAARFNISKDRFEAIIRDPTALKALDQRTQENAKAGDVHATPTFVVNGVGLEPGYQPLTAMDAAIARAHGRG